MKYNIIYLILFTLFFTSCKNNKLLSSKISTSTKPTATDTSYVVVSFYSICCGTNNLAAEEYNKITREFKGLIDTEYYWGKEGEYDHCLDLSNLSTSDRDLLLKKLKQLAESYELVRVTANTPCVHKKQGKNP